VSGALERSLDVAAVLEMRGYGTGRPTGRAPVAPSRHDVAFAASAVAILALGLVASLGSAGAFDAYPLVHVALTPGTVLLALALPVVAWLPFADRRGVSP
jgi:energy-coupling factor transport system permease protein